MPPRRRRRTTAKPESLPTTVDEKASTLLGWCQARQHKECWKETQTLVCNCKCHKEK